MKNSIIPSALLSWYRREKRDLPWRRTRDPYAIWVSEIMLQQTQVDTVIPYFQRWMKQFPTVERLATAPEETVVKAWEGLGYYSRARNLHRAAQLICERHGGKLPSNPEALSALPGIGPYTLGALLAIAFDQPVPAVDGNVLRVFSRLFAIRRNIKDKKTVETVRRLVTELYPKNGRSDMAQAWMELGALVCLPQNPRCLACPLRNHCQAYQQGLTGELPIVDKRPPTRKVETAAVILRQNGRLLLEKRPVGQIMGGLWLFPTVTLKNSSHSKKELSQHFRKELGLDLVLGEKLTTLSHSYTVHRARLHVYPATAAKTPKLRENLQWVEVGKLRAIPFPSAHAKIATKYL